ncbi:MAG TPA: hypothetical protein VFJ93_07470 [Gaiellaceae bacterium]|nr:hypothetical protein [Gaiellaceae bacterium]
MPKIYEFEFEAPPEQVLEETVSAVNLLGFAILESDAESLTFNTGPSIFSNAGQDMTVTAEALTDSSSRLVLSGQAAARGEYGSWGERGRIAKGLAAKVREGLVAP